MFFLDKCTVKTSEFSRHLCKLVSQGKWKFGKVEEVLILPLPFKVPAKGVLELTVKSQKVHVSKIVFFLEKD